MLSGFSKTNDEIFVASREGRLEAMSKNRRSLDTMAPDSVITGELVGICKISQEFFSIMLEKAEQYFLRSRLMDYETDCLVAAAQVQPLDCHLIEDLIWCEIDNVDHLHRARTVIYPAVVARDRPEGRFREMAAR